ncbi:hypothetical protein PIB30_051727 [Stylosanthes scabra]|uniref:Uncharacterized protein n=1 Tax=Stylosanthes scabra TaxID=79078 RepID=A0ABU6SI43_9FABA|nr:hypothetical protein [Stylosanthes scabra]
MALFFYVDHRILLLTLDNTSHRAFDVGEPSLKQSQGSASTFNFQDNLAHIRKELVFEIVLNPLSTRRNYVLDKTFQQPERRALPKKVEQGKRSQ